MNLNKFNEQVNKTLQVLQEGGTIIYPTDTVWGIGCDAENPEAVKRVQAIKSRGNDKNFIVLVHNEQLLHRYTMEFPEICYDLIDASVSPLTIVYPNAQNLPSEVLGNDGSVGIRLVQHQFTHQVIQRLGRGLISTSANISGQKAVGSYDEIPNDIKDKVDYIVEIEREQKVSARPSSVIKIGPKGEVEVLRK